MLHAWQKFGLDAAEADFRSRYDHKHRNPAGPAVSFKRVVKGKIDFLGMVRGKQDSIYLSLTSQLSSLAPELIKQHEPAKTASTVPLKEALVFTEGKSDWKHLKAALHWLKGNGEYGQIDVQFGEYPDNIGGKDDVLQMCRTRSAAKQNPPAIHVFDRDDFEITKKASSSSGNYKDWGNNVYSFVIPVPQHRFQTPNISTEFYYTDPEIMREDANKKRLFLSSEFNPDSGRHLNKNLVYPDSKRLKRQLKKGIHPFIIDAEVHDDQHYNVALPKDDFAEYVLKAELGFSPLDFSQFRAIFDIIVEILSKP